MILLVHLREKGQYNVTRKFELEILNCSRVIMLEMRKSGFLSNPRNFLLNDFLHILITYTKQYNKRIQCRRKPIKRCHLLRANSWFYPNKAWSLLDFSVYISSFCLKFWICLDNAIDNILSNFWIFEWIFKIFSSGPP